MAVGFPTKANWAAGDVLTASALDDLAGTVNLVSAPLYNAAGKNKIINGDFGIWQRGTSFTPTPGGGVIYTADRFNSYNNGTGALTISQQALTPGSITGYESPYFFQAALASAGTTTGWNWVQPIENVQTFAGQTVTLSFWAKSTNAATTTITFSQKFGSGGSTQVDTNSSVISLTSSWTRYTATVTLPSITGKTIGTGSSLTLTWNMGATVSTYGFWGTQLEAGSYATGFQTATGTVQGELAACQRYFQILGALYGYANSTSTIQGTVSAAPMRAAPTSSMTTTTPYAESPVNVTAVTGSGSVTSGSPDVNQYGNQFIRVSGFAGLVAGTTSYVRSNQISLSAEL